MNSLSMIFNPYLSCDEKDMLMELIRLEESNALSEQPQLTTDVNADRSRVGTKES